MRKKKKRKKREIHLIRLMNTFCVCRKEINIKRERDQPACWRKGGEERETDRQKEDHKISTTQTKKDRAQCSAARNIIKKQNYKKRGQCVEYGKREEWSN